MAIHLSDHFTFGRLLRFTLPSILMLIFTSLYTIVDGFFVANFVGKDAFAAITFIFPLFGILGSLGFMFGTGGSAIVGKLLGGKQNNEANRYFSLFVYITAGSGLVLALAGELFLRPFVISIIGAQGEILDNCLLYGRISLLSLPCFMLQFLFQSFFATAEKAKLGLYVTILAGCTNMLLDAIFIVVLHWGLFGAALATALSECLGGLLPVLYFVRPQNSLLQLGRPSGSMQVIWKACVNGFSEFLNNIAYPLLIVLYNYQLLKIAGENGVVAFGVVLYVSFVFVAIFLGYDLGSAPLISYNYGAGNSYELKNVFYKSMILNIITGISLSIIAFTTADFVAGLFIVDDRELFSLTKRALQLYSSVFLFCWLNIYGSSFFTALNNGLISALIAMLRTLIFGALSVLVLPIFLGTDGVWLSWTVAELATLVVTLFCLYRQSKICDAL